MRLGEILMRLHCSAQNIPTVPNRIIREGWLESEAINQLDAPSERFFLRLCLRADDYGRYHANPVLLRSNLFPLREDVRSTDIPRWLAACEKAGLVRCYEVTGTRYLEIPKFNQRMRAAVSKFPHPAKNDGQLTVICQTDDRPPRTEAYSETETKAERAAPAVTLFPLLLNTPEFQAAWTDWLQHRKEIKEPLKPTSEKQQLQNLERIGVDRAIAMIRHTIFKGWRGLREPDEFGHGQTTTPTSKIRVNAVGL